MSPSLQILPPSITDTRSALADWLELEAVAAGNESGLSIRSALGNLCDIPDDLALGEEEGAAHSNDDWLNEQTEEHIDKAFDELEYRSRTLGNNYPFELDLGREKIAFRKNADSSIGATSYLFCLFSCALREKRLSGVGKREAPIGDLFQACACAAAGGYLGGQVSSFGFPRKDKSGFWEALKATYTRFGSGVVHERSPRGLSTSLKDAGVDIVAWKDHPDKLPAKLYLIGQCASGVGWKDKSVVEFVEPLHNCFSQRPARHFTPALFIPFPLHHELEQTGCDFLEQLHGKFWHAEARYGVIFDRFRVVHYAQACLRGPMDNTPSGVDGVGHFEEVAEWVGELMDALGKAR